MSRGVDLRDFISGFLVETDELVRSANGNLLAVEAALGRGENDPRAVRELFRSLHTIKGLAAMVEVEPIVVLAHHMETLLRIADKAGGRLGPAAVEQLLAGTKAIDLRLRALAEQREVPAAPAGLLEALAALDAPEAAAGPSLGASLALEPALLAKLSASEREQLASGIGHGKRALRVDFAPSAARAADGWTITTVRERVAARAEIVKVLPVSTPRTVATPGGLTFTLLLLSSASDAEIEAAAGSAPVDLLPAIEPGAALTRVATSAALATGDSDDPRALGDPWDDGPARRRSGIVRVDVARLDDAMEKLSALIVTRFRLGRAIAALAAQGVEVRALRQIEGEQRRQVRDLRTSILQLRMVSVREMLAPIALVVRGLAAATGKAVRLTLDVGESELYKAVAERILPAIIHLVRNAVDHGIEPKEARLAAGKAAEGQVRITSFARSSTQLELSVSDDGGGIDREAVARRAGRQVPRSDAGLLDLLVLPGFSTRDAATTTSGRGLGMDIVKRVAEELGGELSLQVAPGQGSTFTLRVPLTVAIVDAFSLECGGQVFVVPVTMIEEIVEIDRARVSHAPNLGDPTRQAGLIERRGEALPLLGLAERFGLPGGGSASKALIVRRDGALYAFAVHRLLGQQEIVLRPLRDPLVKVVGVSGVTDLGDGQPTLVLDVLALCGVALREPVEAAA